MKIYIVSVSSSCEYGCSNVQPSVFKTKKEAQKCLSAEYKDAKKEFGDVNTATTKTKDNFTVQNYDCSYDCIDGRIFEVEL